MRRVMVASDPDMSQVLKMFTPRRKRPLSTALKLLCPV